MAKTFTLDGLDVRAVSVAGMETCIGLPSLKTCFDIGHGHRSTARNHTVLFTHAHIDHMGGIGHHAATRSLLSMAPPTCGCRRPSCRASSVSSTPFGRSMDQTFQSSSRASSPERRCRSASAGW